MKCPVCETINCTYEKCRDFLKDLEEIKEEVESLEQLIKDLYPESYGSNNK